MENEIGIVVKVSQDFDFKLKQYLLDLEKTGVKKTKAQLIIELAQVGFNQENALNQWMK
jgi:hypothetical protein